MVTASELDDVGRVCEAVVTLFHPYVEAVVHDVAEDRILAIWNGWSGRDPGDPALLATLPEWDDAGVVGPYAKTSHDGNRVTSVSVSVLEGRALVCLNFDREVLENATQVLQEFAAARVAQPPELFERDWREAIAEQIANKVRQEGWNRRTLTRPQRLEIVAELDSLGLFQVRDAAVKVSQALDVSRATVYSLLRETRES